MFANSPTPCNFVANRQHVRTPNGESCNEPRSTITKCYINGTAALDWSRRFFASFQFWTLSRGIDSKCRQPRGISLTLLMDTSCPPFTNTHFLANAHTGTNMVIRLSLHSYCALKNILAIKYNSSDVFILITK